mgnify:CR=1 FL=1
MNQAPLRLIEAAEVIVMRADRARARGQEIQPTGVRLAIDLLRQSLKERPPTLEAEEKAQ